MEATRKNRRIAKQIMELLAREGCTVRQAEEILAFVGRAARDLKEYWQPIFLSAVTTILMHVLLD